MVNFRALVLDRHRHLKWKALDKVEATLMVLCGLCIFMFTLTVFCDVVTRTVGLPWLWLQQVTTAFFAWGIFLGMAAATRRNDHFYLTEITKRMKGLGDYVAGAPFIEVLELTTVDQLEADLRLPESYLPQVTAGKTRLALRSPLMKRALDLAVSRVIPNIDTQRGTFAVRVAIPSEERCGLVPGAFVTAALNFDGAGASVVAPQQAIVAEEGKYYVFVAAGGKMRRQAVELGDRLTEGIIVKSGLRAGEMVVVGPARELKDGAPLPDYLGEKREQP